MNSIYIFMIDKKLIAINLNDSFCYFNLRSQLNGEITPGFSDANSKSDTQKPFQISLRRCSSNINMVHS